MHQEFRVKKTPCIYDPDTFRQFCISSGASTIFDNILSSVTTSRRSAKRSEQNRKICVNIIYTLCFALSQLNNFLQKDQSLFFILKNLNKEALDTERNLGNVCSSRKVYYMRKNIEHSHQHQINDEIEKAIQGNYLVVCIVDDYHCIHTKRRPEDVKVSDAKHMCTIVIKIFSKIPAIPLTTKMEDLHNPEGVSAEVCCAMICGQASMVMLSNSFASTMPIWAKHAFFDPENERTRLHVHDYASSPNIKDLRCMDSVYLLEMKELPLKSFANFKKALTWIAGSKLQDYMKKNVLLMPGDWPAQFYIRQAVYQPIYPKGGASALKNIPESPVLSFDHGKYTFYIPSSKNTGTTTPWKKEIDSIIPLIGPLHISLNAREDICEIYHPLIKYIYEQIFPKCQLANKPKPWRVSLILEIIYGGWTIIRDTVVDCFTKCKLPQYAVLYNLLDNYIPVVLIIYAISLKQNKFNEYFRAMIRIWTMFYCFQRKHYNKAPLIWLSNIGYWSNNHGSLFQTLTQYISCTDEYPVENTHSIIRSNTLAADDCETISKKAKMIFTAKTELKSFKSVFTPPKPFSFSRNVLRSLKVKAAEIIANLLKLVTDASATKLQDKLQLNKENIKCLPLGFHTSKPPNPHITCDMPACLLQDKKAAWKRFNGCFHSFHLQCLNDLDHCPICCSHLKMVIQKLASSAQQSIHNAHNDEYVPEDNEDHAFESAPDITALGEDHFQAKVNAIKKEVKGIDIPDPETSKPPNTLMFTEFPKVKQSRPPHCKICGHPVKGHCTKEKTRKCMICPGKECSPSNDTKDQCPCEWHQEAGHNKSSTARSGKYKIKKNVHLYQTTTEYILPSELSQYSLSPSGFISNACTAIAILVGLRFLQENLQIPTVENEDNLQFIIQQYRQIMIEGNTLYSIINPPSHQPNLAVQDVLSSINFPLSEMPFVAVNNYQSFAG